MPLDLHLGYLPGCIGRVAELHALYYSEHAGFGLPFEAKVARELAEFCGRCDARRDGLWLARIDGRIHGSIAIDGLHADSEGVHLRWFITSDEARGRGVGRSLLDTALGFCRERHRGRVHLSTFAGLEAARHLYEKAGFRLVQQQRGAQWGREVDEQRFELAL
jgi:GNAT superfamily N-acetyltransferase